MSKNCGKLSSFFTVVCVINLFTATIVKRRTRCRRGVTAANDLALELPIFVVP